MGSYPLPALHVNPPAPQPDPLEQYGRLAALQQQQAMRPLQMQQAQNQVQEGQVDLQQKQQQLTDQKAMTSAMQQWDGNDYKDILPLAIKNGASSTAVMGLKSKILEQQQSISTALKNNGDAAVAQMNAAKTKGDLLGGTLSTLIDPKQTPDGQLPQAVTQAAQDLQQRGILDPQHAAQVGQLLQSGDPTAIRQQLTLMKNANLAQSQITEEAQKQAATKADQYKVVNGTLYDMSGETPKPALGNQLNPQQWSQAVDSVVPPSGANAALNARTKSQVQFYLQQGNTEAAQKAITQASDQIGSIEKETNPQVQQNKINTAAAEGAARANVEAQAARGSNAALAQVPPHLVGPASSAAAKAGEDYAQANSVSQRIAEVMNDARNGNVVAYQLLPQEGALQVTTSQGVKRINMAEIQNYGGGSLWQDIQGKLGKAATGASIPASVLNDMGQMQDIMARGSQAKYENDLNTINQTYGAKFQPVPMKSMTPSAQGGAGAPKVGDTKTFPNGKTGKWDGTGWEAQ